MGSVNRSRYFLIGIGVLLMAALVAVVGQGLTAGQRPAEVPPGEVAPPPTLPAEAGMYTRPPRPVDYAAMPSEPNRKRTRPVYYARRDGPGEPPVIPHAVDASQTSGRLCLACHADGGWVPRFDAYTPLTPHPELDSCQDCHSPAEPGRRPPASASSPPALRTAALPGAPPPIPHTLEMRERCQACHAGPGAVDELRTTHPERAGCRQCHALGSQPAEAFSRPPAGGGG
jgi:cytochrome c-type protein NapB